MCGYVGQIKLTAKCSQEQFSLGYTYRLPSFPSFFLKKYVDRGIVMVMVIKDAGYVVLLQQYSMTKDKLMIVVEL